MNLINILGPVIRKVDSIPKLSSKSEKIVIFNKKDKTILDKKPWSLFSGGNIELYRISTSAYANYKGLSVSIEDFESNRKIGLLIDYRASCESGNEEQLVLGLCSDVPPGLNLNRRIERWIAQLTRDSSSEFIDNFVSRINWLKRELQREAEDIGLRLEIRISTDKTDAYYLISNANALEALAERDNLFVAVKDVENDREIGINITYSARFRDISNRDKVIKALEGYSSVSDALDARIKEWVTEYVSSQPAKFIDEYDSELITLKQRIEAKARLELNLLLDTRIELDRNPVEYILLESRDISNLAQGECIIPIRGISSGRLIDIKVTYKAGYSLQNKDRVTQAFSTFSSLTTEINKRIEVWTARYIDKETADGFIDEYANKVDELKSFLLQRSLSETGLNLELRLQLDKRSSLTTFEYGSSQKLYEIPVHVKDYDDELTLGFHIKLGVDSKNIVNAVLRSQPSQEFPIGNLVKKLIEDYIQTSITLNQFCYELKTSVRDKLVVHLNHKLSNYGRTVNFLLLEASSIPSVPQEIIEINCPIECEIYGYSEKITVDNTVQMLPDRNNLSVFRKMVPDSLADSDTDKSPLHIWVENKLEKIVKPELLRRRYIEVLTNFEDVSTTIKVEMEKVAKEIGFSVEQLVSVPDLKHLELKRDFSIEIEDQNYLTNDANVEVRLNVAITAKIENFQTIEEYLVQYKDVSSIKAKIRKSVDATVREYLNGVEPAQYYMHFYRAAVNENGKSIGLPVNKELEERITKMLQNKFGAKVISVVSRQLNTEIIERFRELRGKIGQFEFGVNVSGEEPIRFYAEFQVRGVDPTSWYVFQERMESLRSAQEQKRQERNRLKDLFTRLVKSSDLDDAAELKDLEKRIRNIEEELSGVEKIRQSIESGIQDPLSRIGGRLASALSPKEMDGLKTAINQWARESVRLQYGLEIIVQNIRRLPTKEEERRNKLLAQSREAQYLLDEDNIHGVLESLGSRKQTRSTQRELQASDNKAKLVELKKLRDKRAQLITKPDPESFADDLDYLDKEIEKLVEEINLPSLEGAKDALQGVAQSQLAPTESDNLLETLGNMGVETGLAFTGNQSVGQFSSKEKQDLIDTKVTLSDEQPSILFDSDSGTSNNDDNILPEIIDADDE